jgi:hypothetical protein
MSDQSLVVSTAKMSLATPEHVDCCHNDPTVDLPNQLRQTTFKDLASNTWVKKAAQRKVKSFR